ncbi:MAG: hypothetical protein R3C32_08245 [Chloroflexota bacterium]
MTSTGVFLTGGNQLRLSSTIGGTGDRPCHGGASSAWRGGRRDQRRRRDVQPHGRVRKASGGTPKQRMVQMAAGLGYPARGHHRPALPAAEPASGRLLATIAQNPAPGTGIDEDTAVVVSPDMTMEVIGRRSITIVDGSESETDAWEVSTGPSRLWQRGAPLAAGGLSLDLRRRVRIAAPALRALDVDTLASS